MAAKIRYPTSQELCAELRYDDGLLYWRVAKGKRKLDKPVGSKTSNGYLTVHWWIDGERRRLLVHRVIWVMLKDDDPDTIDHINRDRTDNRIENLRNVSLSDNHRNRVDTHRVYDLPRGVTLQRGRIKAQRKYAGRTIYLGLHDNPESAHQAYAQASAKLGLPVYAS